MSPLRAVFFDFGGTLFSYTAFQRATRGGDGKPLFVQAAEKLGVDADRRTIAKAYGRGSARAFRKYTERPYYLHRDLFEDTFRMFANELGTDADESFVEWFYELQRETLLDKFDLRDDCMTTLLSLRDEGLSLHIVSNIDDDYLHPMVAKSGLDAVLEHWTSSEEAKSCKPDPRFFEICLEKAEVEPTDVLFVGDSPVHDVAGASALGMKTALIVEEGAEPPGQLGEAPPADYEIRSLSELVPICRR